MAIPPYSDDPLGLYVSEQGYFEGRSLTAVYAPQEVDPQRKRPIIARGDHYAVLFRFQVKTNGFRTKLEFDICGMDGEDVYEWVEQCLDVLADDLELDHFSGIKRMRHSLEDREDDRAT